MLCKSNGVYNFLCTTQSMNWIHDCQVSRYSLINIYHTHCWWYLIIGSGKKKTMILFCFIFSIQFLETDNRHNMQSNFFVLVGTNFACIFWIIPHSVHTHMNSSTPVTKRKKAKKTKQKKYHHLLLRFTENPISLSFHVVELFS